MTWILQRKERTFLFACTYLGALFISCIILWWSVLIGGNPLEWKGSQIIDSNGQATTILEQGKPYGVFSKICSSRNVGVEVYPSMRSKNGIIYPLQPGMIQVRDICGHRVTGFIMPDLPPGEYTYQAVVKFQTSLVGRDESALSPGILVRVK